MQFISKGVDQIVEAVKFDSVFDYGSALDGYQLALTNLMKGMKYETKENTKRLVQKKIGKVLERAELIKKYVADPNSIHNPTPSSCSYSAHTDHIQSSTLVQSDTANKIWSSGDDNGVGSSGSVTIKKTNMNKNENKNDVSFVAIEVDLDPSIIKAESLIQKAQTLEKSKQLDVALSAYQEGLGILVQAMKAQQDAEKKAYIKKKIFPLMTQAENVKNAMERESKGRE